MYAHFFIITVSTKMKVKPSKPRSSLQHYTAKDFMEVCEHELSSNMNQICFWRESLYHGAFSRRVTSWMCFSCFANQSGRTCFACYNETCLFKRISGWGYRVCPSCFNSTENSVIDVETDQKEDGIEAIFIGTKTRRILSTSGVYSFLFRTVLF